MSESNSHIDSTMTTVELYNKYTGYIVNVMRKYFPDINKGHLIYDDLISAAEYGLWKGVRAYVNEPQGFAGYLLYRYILNAVSAEYQRFLGRKGSLKHDMFINSRSADVVVKHDGDEYTLYDSLPSQWTDWNVITDWIDVKITISKMNSKQQAVAYYLLRGYTQREIAQLLGYSYSYISRILKQIRKLLR